MLVYYDTAGLLLGSMETHYCCLGQKKVVLVCLLYRTYNSKARSIHVKFKGAKINVHYYIHTEIYCMSYSMSRHNCQMRRPDVTYIRFFPGLCCWFWRKAY